MNLKESIIQVLLEYREVVLYANEIDNDSEIREDAEYGADMIMNLIESGLK